MRPASWRVAGRTRCSWAGYSQHAARPEVPFRRGRIVAAPAPRRAQSRDEGPSRHVLGPPVVSVQGVRFLPAALRACRSGPSSRDCPHPAGNSVCRLASLGVTKKILSPASPPRCVVTIVPAPLAQTATSVVGLGKPLVRSRGGWGCGIKCSRRERSEAANRVSGGEGAGRGRRVQIDTRAGPQGGSVLDVR